MSFTKTLLGVCAVGALCGGQAFAMTVLIGPDTNNGSFEYAGGVLNTAKIQMWDTTPDIDNWTEWAGESTDANDSGVENTGFASDGTMIAFLRGGNAAYNLTSHVVSEGDIFEFSWDHVRRADRDHSVWLVYDDGGTITKIAASQTDSSAANTTPYTYSGAYTVLAGDPAIGKPIGIGIHTFGAYPEVDNFNLSLVPEPCTVALAGFALVGLAAARRSRR